MLVFVELFFSFVHCYTHAVKSQNLHYIIFIMGSKTHLSRLKFTKFAPKRQSCGYRVHIKTSKLRPWPSLLYNLGKKPIQSFCIRICRFFQVINQLIINISLPSIHGWILPIRRKTLSNQSIINQSSINQSINLFKVCTAQQGKSVWEM